MLTFRFSGSCGVMTEPEVLTSGMVGKQVLLEFSRDWEGLTKTVVFSSGSISADVVYTGGAVAIPARILEKPLRTLWVGAYGVSSDGKLVIPTIRAEGPKILPGVEPAGEQAADPDLPIWAQLQGVIGSLEHLKTEDRENLVAAINEVLRKAGSGQFNGTAGDPGAAGVTPHIGANGNWFIGTTDTGVNARGQDGNPGRDGRGIRSIIRTSGNGAAGTTDTYTITYTDDTTGTFTLRNGSDGAPGTSVTVKSVTESTEDGGTNLVEFTDGQTVTVQNGRRGAAGQAATFEITGVTALAYGATPTVNEQSGSTAQARKYALGIPAGKPGKDGQTPVLTMFISPDGSDSNDGLTAATPKKTVKACVNAGASRISAKRGIYKENIQLGHIGELEIFPTDNDLTYAVGAEREPIVFDTSDTVAVSSLAAYNTIKRVAYSNSANTQFDKVFTKKSQPPVVGSGSRYNSTIWLLSEDERTVCIKLKPVLTVAECEAEADTFTYASSYIYINANMTGVEKIVVPTNWETGFYINGADRLVLKEVEVRFSGTYNIDIRNCAYFDFYKCACKYTSYGSGFHPFNSNGRMTACYATKNFDGYGISGYGHTTYVDCVSEFNFDDGMSHHDGTSGTVIGGRYEGNGKGGNAPAYGAKVNIYGGLYKDNASFGIGYLWASGLESAGGMVQGAVMVGNPIGLSVNANCDVTAMNCVYKDNTTDKDANGNLTEYNASYIKTINGNAADRNGNINLNGVTLAPAYTNQLPIATDASGAVYNGTGYENGYRLNSSATRKEQAGCGHTGFIPVEPGAVLRFKNIPACMVGHGYIHYFKDDKATAATASLSIAANTFTADENGVYSYALSSTAGISYIRLSYGEMSADSIITINEEITD